MNALWVEDDAELNRQLFVELTELGYEVQAESNGRSGLKLALEQQWDIAVLDISLPEVSGVEIVEKMRAEEIDTPVIFLTA
ncbi:MAG: response regulator [Verrucomicrobiales bacterium]|nr:response regulator [Verrucomicrobiales bacterium]